jgi:very-short-patch-repair endonuclease
VSSTEPPRTPKSPPEAAIWENRSVQTPGIPKSPIAAPIWGLAAVAGKGDSEISRIAELQRGIVHRRQLLEAGIAPAGIKHRLATGRLHRLYPRVYVVGRPRLEPLAAATAAVMHFEGHAVLSELSGGLLWELTDAPELPVVVTVIGIDARSRPNLTVHRVVALSPADVRLWKGLPVTSPARTLVDLAGVLTIDEIEAALAIVRGRKLATDQEILEAIARAPYAKGVANLRALLAQTGPQRLTRSKYERKLLKLIAAAQLPRPLPNAKVEGIEVDLCWPDHRLIVEFDSLAFHSDRTAFEKDRLRDQRLTAAGYRVIRITARQLDTTPEAVIARIAQALIR